MSKTTQGVRKPRNSRKYQPQKKTQKITALALQDVTVTTEKEQKSLKQTPWYPFFKDSDNIYINDLAKRARRSPTHGAILQSKAVYTAGTGFTYNKDGEQIPEETVDQKFLDWIKEINSNRQSLHWLFGKEAYDYTYSGNVYIEVKKGKEFTSAFYMDASKVRVSEETAYVSAWWHVIKNDPSQISHNDYPVEKIDLWDGKLDTKQDHFVMHIKNDVPEFDYYGLPEHLQVLKWADVEYKIVQFNLSELENGFFPSVMMNIIGTPPEGMNEQTYVEKVRDGFTGEGKNGKMVIQMVDSVDQAVQITEFSGVKEGQLLQLAQTAQDKIIAGHRWFPSLAGIATAGSLDSNQQIRNEYNIALKGVIIPQFQNPLLKGFNDLIKIAGFDYEVGILNVAPVGIEDKLDPKLVLTEDEQRELLGYEPKTDEQKVQTEQKKDKEVDNG